MGRLAKFLSPSARRILDRIFPIRSLAFCAVVMLAIGMVGFFSMALLKSKAWWIVKDTLPGLSDSAKACSQISEDFDRILMALLSSNPADRERLCRESDDFNVLTAASLGAYDSAIYEEADRANFEKLQQQQAQFNQIRRDVLALLTRQLPDEARSRCKSSLVRAYESYKLSCEVLLNYNTRQAQARGETILHVCTLTSCLVAAMAIALFIVGFFIGIFR